MLRKIQVLFVLVAFCAALFPARALAADVGEVRWKSGKGGEYVETKSGRYFKITEVVIDAFAGIDALNRYMASRLSLMHDDFSFGDFTCPEAVHLIGTAFGDPGLFFRAWGDLHKALNDPRADAENLRDPEKRYEFFKDHGFYDKYTAQERAFINRVVMPVMVGAEGILGLGGVGLAAWGASVLVGGSLLFPAFLVGAGAVAAITLWKGYQVARSGAAPDETLASNDLTFAFGLGGSLAGSIEATAGTARLASISGSVFAQRLIGLFQGTNTLSRVVHGLGLLGKHAVSTVGGGVAVGAGLSVALESSNEITRLVNIWNIPEPVSYQELWEEAGVSSRDVKVETVEELSLDYRLTK